VHLRRHRQKGYYVLGGKKKLEEKGALVTRYSLASTRKNPRRFSISRLLAPAIAEYFRGSRSPSLCVYDDLTQHAWRTPLFPTAAVVLREREALRAMYSPPFRLLERAAQLSDI